MFTVITKLMKLIVLKVLYIAALILSVYPVYSQHAAVYFSSLSSENYKPQLAQLRSRSAKILYDNKKEQKSYSEFVKEADKYVADALENDEVIFDTLLLNRCEAVKRKLQFANQGFPFDSLHMYLNRSSVPNAYAIGGSGSIFQISGCCYGLIMTRNSLLYSGMSSLIIFCIILIKRSRKISQLLLLKTSSRKSSSLKKAMMANTSDLRPLSKI